ncbi:MAG: hypothetical protein ABJA49_02880 [Betaproteobacteria bacterium]
MSELAQNSRPGKQWAPPESYRAAEFAARRVVLGQREVDRAEQILKRRVR